MENILYTRQTTHTRPSDRQDKQIQIISYSTNFAPSPAVRLILGRLSLFPRPMQRIRLIPGPESKRLTASGMTRGDPGTTFGLMETTTTRSLIPTLLMLEPVRCR